MNIPIARLILSGVLILAGLSCWAAAGVAEDLALRHERLATFQDGAAPARSGWMSRVERWVQPAGAVPRAAAEYWGEGEAAAPVPERASDDADLLVEANTTYRQAQRLSGTVQMSVEHLDQALQAYAAVLKNEGFSRDAAYNYEYVARLRDSIARSKPPAAKTRPPLPASAAPDDLPSGATIHGRPGLHPPPARGEEFEVITPMDYGEREAQPEPTPGRPLPRKG